MEGLTPTALLRAAHDAGLTVTTDGDALVVRGPRRAAKEARALLERKAEVLPLVRAGAALPGLVLHMAAELDYPQVMSVTGQPLGPGEADWRRVVESPRLVEPVRGMLLGALKGALARRLAGVPRNESWSLWAQREPALPRSEAAAAADGGGR